MTNCHHNLHNYQELMKKIFIFIFLLTFVGQAKASEPKYNAEDLSVIIVGNNAKVFSRGTLVYNNSTDRYSIKNLFDGNQSTAWATKFIDNITGRAYEEGLFKIIFNKKIIF